MTDIFILYKLRTQFKWVAKADLFNAPFMGWMMSLCEYIKLERGDFSSVKKTYREASSWLRRGISILFFPEGTRSKDGRLQPFQNGAFKIAIKEKADILPVCINGTWNILQKGGWVIKNVWQECSVTVLPPIETNKMDVSDFEDLVCRAHKQISEALKS